MAYTPIDKSDDYFNTLLYTGTGATNAITGVGFAPDFVWLKNRDSAVSNYLFDTRRGATKLLFSNASSAEITAGTSLTAFGSDGFTLGTDSGINGSGVNNVSWNWLAGGTGVSNTNGSITSTVSANTTAGFSIVGYTGNGSSAQTVGHGLNSAPEIIFTKNRIDGNSWQVGSDYLTSWSYYMRLNTTDPQYSDGGGQVYGTAPTSTVFTVGNDNAVNGSSDGIISYCFHSVKGYSKMGKYTGNGSTDGPFVYTGFKPAWVMIKRTDSTASWVIEDSVRSPSNSSMKVLYPSLTNAEETLNPYFDLLSNGFKIRWTSTFINASGGTYIYMAFAENRFVTSTGIPACAR